MRPGRTIAASIAVGLVAVAAAFLLAAPFRAEEASPSAPSGASAQKRWTAVAPGRVEPLARDIKIAASVLGRAAAARRAGRASQAGLDSARLALSLAYDRLREQQDALRKVKAAPGTALPGRLEGELNVSRAELTLAEAELEKIRIRAPLSGTVLQVQAKLGELGTPSSEQPLALLGD